MKNKSKKLFRHNENQVINRLYYGGKVMWVEVNKEDETDVPHMHVYVGRVKITKNGIHTKIEKCVCVRIDRCEYYYHRRYLGHKFRKKFRFTPDELLIFHELMHRNNGNIWVSKSGMNKLSGYRHVVKNWCDAFGQSDKVYYEDRNFCPRPVYEELNTTHFSERFEFRRECRISQPLYKGIFWIKDVYELLLDDPCTFKIPVDENGNVIGTPKYGNEPCSIPLNSKKGDNYNHKKTWEQLSKKITRNKAYDYYPRGRVEVRGSKAIIYAHPSIVNRNDVKEFLIDEFNLIPEKGIKEVVMKPDHSKHYQCYLDWTKWQP